MSFANILANRAAAASSNPAGTNKNIGRTDEPIDFTRDEGSRLPAIVMPNEDDNLETLLVKLDAVRRVVEENKSVALYSDFQGTPSGTTSAREIAEQHWSEMQKTYVRDYEENGQLPELAFGHGAGKPGEEEKKRARQREDVELLNMMYGRSDLTLYILESLAK